MQFPVLVHFLNGKYGKCKETAPSLHFPYIFRVVFRYFSGKITYSSSYQIFYRVKENTHLLCLELAIWQHTPPLTNVILKTQKLSSIVYIKSVQILTMKIPS